MLGSFQIPSEYIDVYGYNWGPMESFIPKDYLYYLFNLYQDINRLGLDSEFPEEDREDDFHFIMRLQDAMLWGFSGLPHTTLYANQIYGMLFGDAPELGTHQNIERYDNLRANFGKDFEESKPFSSFEDWVTEIRNGVNNGGMRKLSIIKYIHTVLGYFDYDNDEVWKAVVARNLVVRQHLKSFPVFNLFQFAAIHPFETTLIYPEIGYTLEDLISGLADIADEAIGKRGVNSDHSQIAIQEQTAEEIEQNFLGTVRFSLTSDYFDKLLPYASKINMPEDFTRMVEVINNPELTKRIISGGNKTLGSKLSHLKAFEHLIPLILKDP